MQIEVAQHADLKRRVYLPRRLRLTNSNGINEMKHDFHGQKSYEEANAVKHGALDCDALWHVTLLGNIIIESQDRSSDVQRWVKHVSKVVPEGNVSMVSR